MTNQKVWAVSVISGAVGLATVGYTAWTTHTKASPSQRRRSSERRSVEAWMQKEDEVDEKKGAPNAEPKK